MLTSIAAVISGLALLIWSADRFVDGAAAAARLLGVSTLIIGIIVVGFGTSAPEIGVSVIAVLEDTPGIAIGNALGSNIANIGMVLGTTLLIAPSMFPDFDSYNQFLELAEGLLELLDLQGVFQIASSHPAYQFAGTAVDDAENYTNRSPYPMLHLLREASIEVAVAAHPGIDEVPERNIRHLRKLGTEALAARLRACFQGQG